MTTTQTLRDYLDWQCQVGRGHYAVKLSHDSILGVVCEDIQIIPALPEYVVDDKSQTVFVKAVLGASSQ